MNTKPVQPTTVLALAITAILLVVGFLLLLSLVDDDDRAQPARSCPAVSGAPLNPATCQPYSSSGTAAVPGTSGSRSSVQKPKQNAPAPKAPAAPPRISVRK